jgi:hypothetical protein
MSDGFSFFLLNHKKIGNFLGAPRLLFCSIAKTGDAGLSPDGTLCFIRLRFLYLDAHQVVE